MIYAMKIIEVWPRGYAHEDGIKELRIADDENPNLAAYVAFGPAARIRSWRPAVQAPVEPVDEAYARMMSRNDNS